MNAELQRYLHKHRYLIDEAEALYAVKQDYRALQYIRNQTEKMGLLALEQVEWVSDIYAYILI